MELFNAMVFNVCIQVTESNKCAFELVFNPFSEEAENAYFQRNPSIRVIDVNLRLKNKQTYPSNCSAVSSFNVGN